MQFYHCSEQLEWFEQIQIPEQIFTFADDGGCCTQIELMGQQTR
jgi:hypothetical protein